MASSSNEEILAVLFMNSANAQYTNLGAGVAQFAMEPALQFHQGQRIKLAMSQFSFTNWFMNISAALGNNLFTYTDDILNLTKYSVTISDGSYSVDELSQAINVGVLNNSHTDGLFVLSPDYASNRVLVSISAAGWLVNWGVGTSYLLNGFALADTVPVGGALTLAAYSELAPNVATYNNITNLYVHCSLTANSNFSGRNGSVIGSAIPTSNIGSIQSSEPNNLVWIDASQLSGSTVSSVQINIRDQSGNDVVLSDHFGCVVMIVSY